MKWQQSLTEIVYLLYLSYKNLECVDEAKILLNNWIEKNPSDDNAQKLLDEILPSVIVMKLSIIIPHHNGENFFIIAFNHYLIIFQLKI